MANQNIVIYFLLELIQDSLQKKEGFYTCNYEEIKTKTSN